MKEHWKQRYYNTFLSFRNPCTFLLSKEKTWKRIFNTNYCQLSQNRTEKQIMPSKATINSLINSIYVIYIYHDNQFYFFIACFYWEIDVFQRTGVRVHYILNPTLHYHIKKGIISIYQWNTSVFILPWSFR